MVDEKEFPLVSPECPPQVSFLNYARLPRRKSKTSFPTKQTRLGGFKALPEGN